MVGALGGAVAAAGVLFGVSRARAFERSRPGESEAEEPDVSDEAHPEPPPGQLPRIRDKREARADELVIVQKLKVERRTAAAYERLLAAAVDDGNGGGVGEPSGRSVGAGDRPSVALHRCAVR